ncbi:hypothetical protein [Thalassobaculum sp.]|uniref:hypothetical protein n=1 Tax=Thalassobaculum sp. TaxID=2022740 RepID=UPI0032EB26F4
MAPPLGPAARRVATAGRKGDTELAHMDPGKAALLKAKGGAGTRNRRTGLLEYWSGEGDSDNNGDGVGGGPGDSGMGGGAPQDNDSEHGTAHASTVAGQQNQNQQAENDPQTATNAEADDSIVDRVKSFIAKRSQQVAISAVAPSLLGIGIGAIGKMREGVEAEYPGFTADPTTNDVDGWSEQPTGSTAAAARPSDNYHTSGKGLLARQAEAVQAAGRDGDTIVAHVNPREVQMLLRAGGRGTINPKTGLLEFASLNQVTRGGVTMGFDNQAEADAWAAANPQDSQDQAEAVAALPTLAQVGQPAPTIDDVKSQRGAEWNAPGGGGYAAAMAGGTNDPTSDPANPQAFTNDALRAAGVDTLKYHQQNVAQGAGFTDFGTRTDFNQRLVAYLKSKGYDVDFDNMGEGQFTDWYGRQDGAVRSDVDSWLAANDPTYGAATPGASPNAPGAGAPAAIAPPKTTSQNIDDIMASDSPLMRRTASQGLMLANRRGLLNSSVAAEAAQAAMLDAAVPIASTDASLANQQYMQGQDIASQQYMQGRDIASQQTMQGRDIASRNWQAQLSADTQTAIANMQVRTADKDKIGNMVATLQQIHASKFNTIANNPDIPAETRDRYIQDNNLWMRTQLNLIESMYGVQLPWTPPT